MGNFKDNIGIKIIAIIGIIAIIFGIYIQFKNYKFSKNAVIIDGTITNVKEQIFSEDKRYSYDVEYTVDGKKYSKHISDVKMSKMEYHSIKNNTHIDVYYNPDNPEECEINHKINLNGIWLAIFGIICLFAIFKTYIN